MNKEQLQRLFNYFSENHDVLLMEDDFRFIVDLIKDELIEAHSEGIRFMAGDSSIPQPASISWYRKKYERVNRIK